MMIKCILLNKSQIINKNKIGKTSGVSHIFLYINYIFLKGTIKPIYSDLY